VFKFVVTKSKTVKKFIFYQAVLFLSGIVVLLLGSFKTNEKKHKKLNVIVLLADDLGKYEVSAYGGKIVPTPNIDSIGIKGCKFNEGYASAAICAPSRAGLLTGNYQQRFGFEFQPHKKYPRSFIIRGFYKMFMRKDESWCIERGQDLPSRREVKQEGLPLEQLTMAEFFKQNGYTTGMVGKWHLGYHSPSLPNQRGFDHFYGFTEAFSLYAPENSPGIVNAQLGEFTDRHMWNQGRGNHCAIKQNDKTVYPEDYITFRFANEAVNFIDKNKDKPFFLYVPFSAPHTPFQAPKNYYDKFAHIEDHNKRVYYAMIAALDDAVGSITKKVRELGLEENTVIVFASDNGAATYLNVGNNTPLKGGKFTLFEGGINVPFLMQWKGAIQANTVVNHPVSLIDIFPTMAAAAGLKLPENENFDGVNLLPAITNNVSEAPHEAMFWRSGYNRAIRKGNWKMIVDERNMLIHLYHLGDDKYEAKNIRETYPDIVSSLMDEMMAWDESMTKPTWPFVMNYKVIINGEKFIYAI